MNTCIISVGVINALADSMVDLYEKYICNGLSGLKSHERYGKAYSLGLIDPSRYECVLEYPFNNRVNKLALAACKQIETMVIEAKKRYGAGRIGVVIGTTDNGSEETNAYLKDSSSVKNYSLYMQSLNLCADFVKKYFGLEGLSFTVSTACTSSANAIIRAEQLINAGVCDAVIAGGADVVTDTVLLGFTALDAVDRETTKPFSKNRKGINLGEGAALFLLAREPFGDDQIVLKGYSDNSDAFHMTSPDIEARISSICIEEALNSAGLTIQDIDYINLHGTGTSLNDIMESNTLVKTGAAHIPCSSSKPVFGHTLGASSAMELAVCCAVLSRANTQKLLPVHLYDGEYDESLERINLVEKQQRAPNLETLMNISFAFGGSNTCLIVGKI